MSEAYIDTDHADDLFSYSGGNPVQLLRFVGDTSGDESGTKTSVMVTLRDINVQLESCTDDKEQE